MTNLDRAQELIEIVQTEHLSHIADRLAALEAQWKDADAKACAAKNALRRSPVEKYDDFGGAHVSQGHVEKWLYDRYNAEYLGRCAAGLLGRVLELRNLLESLQRLS